MSFDLRVWARKVAELGAVLRSLTDGPETGQAADLADLARRFKLTRARVTQISNYALLPPDIQEEVLAKPPVEPGHEPIREPAMRTVPPRGALDRAAEAVACASGPCGVISARCRAPPRAPRSVPAGAESRRAGRGCAV